MYLINSMLCQYAGVRSWWEQCVFRLHPTCRRFWRKWWNPTSGARICWSWRPEVLCPWDNHEKPKGLARLISFGNQTWHVNTGHLYPYLHREDNSFSGFLTPIPRWLLQKKFLLQSFLLGMRGHGPQSYTLKKKEFGTNEFDLPSVQTNRVIWL